MSQLLGNKVSQRLQELGSQLLSLLLISSENSTDIINAINNKATDVPRSMPLRSVGEELNEELLAKLEKRRKNAEASARFRVRRKQRNLEKLARMEQLKQTVNNLNCRIDDLLVENSFWKDKLETVNQLRSEKLLDKIKKKNTSHL